MQCSIKILENITVRKIKIDLYAVNGWIKNFIKVTGN